MFVVFSKVYFKLQEKTEGILSGTNPKIHLIDGALLDFCVKRCINCLSSFVGPVTKISSLRTEVLSELLPEERCLILSHCDG